MAYDYTQIHKSSSVVNAHSSIHQDIHNITRTTDSQNLAKYVTVIYREKYVQLVCLLHQANFILSINNDVGSNSNQFTSSYMVCIVHSWNEPTSSNICNIYNSNTTFSCSASNKNVSNA